MTGIISAFIPVIFVVFIVLLMHHDQKLEKSIADKIEYRLTRTVSYRGFYAVIRYSYDYNVFFLRIDDKMGNKAWLIPDDKKEEMDYKTESDALRRFHDIIDSILDEKK